MKREIIGQIKEKANSDLQTVIGNYVTLQPPKTGTEFKGICPKCGSRHFCFSRSKGIYKCWSCNWGGSDATSFVMESQGVDFITAIEQLGHLFCIDTQEPVSHTPIPDHSGRYCERMLAESGLSPKDIMADVRDYETSGTVRLRTMIPGTVNQFGEIEDGDDVIIRYYNLDGYPVQYECKDTKNRSISKKKDYYRVRWQFPQSHLDKEGKPYKYKSPSGSGTPIYIPQHIRTAFKQGKELSRLYIQEGEKKAEKACKHGLPSIAISGIMNLGNHGALPEDLIRIIRNCHVQEVIFLMDGDWNDLSRSSKITEDISKRPRNFFYAAKNYKEYMRGLKNENIYVEIYLGHVISRNGDKGIDDLLAHTLKGREHELLKDIDTAINNQKDMTGQYCQLYKITSWSDHKLETIWGLDSCTAFVDMHKEELRQLPEFTFGRHRWKIDEEGRVKFASPFDDDEKFWEEREIISVSGAKRTEASYRYVKGMTFLTHRGFGRYRLKNGNYQFVQIESPFIKTVQSFDVRDYLLQFAKINCPEVVNEMLIKGSTQYLGPDKLSTLDYIEPNFLEPDRSCQYFYFRDSCWKITASEVEEVLYPSISHNVWIERKKDFPAQYIGSLVNFAGGPGEYSFSLTPAGEKCHFLKFLQNCSNFTWKMRKEDITDKEKQDNVQHLLSKLCAIGYLVLDAKDPTVAKAVIAMDGQQSEVGVSNGRTGKSLVGELMKHLTPTLHIDGKKPNLLEDTFVWHEMTEKTRIVFIDDVRQSFNFELMFPSVTGDWTVNYKHGDRITLPFSASPKIYIPTNHAIKGEGSSFTDRQWLLAFSDYYNDAHKPADDFGTMFFYEWDYEQWNLTWNLIANCVQLYLRYGVVEAPSELLELRKLRQEISEGFLLWADTYFSDENRYNIAIPRHDLQESYFEYEPLQRKYVSPQMFKVRFKKYCTYRGLIFNPQMYDAVTGRIAKYDRNGKPVLDDKKNGVEYFTVGQKPGETETDAPF